MSLFRDNPLTGLFGDSILADPTTRQMVGLQMIANSGPSVGAPRSLFDDMAPMVAKAQAINEKRREEEEERQRKEAIAQALGSMPGMEQYGALLQADPELALDFAKFQRGEAQTPLSSAGKLQWDHEQGFLSDDAYQAELSQLGGGSAKDQQIQRLMETGVDRSTAIGIVDGRVRPSINPQTGERVLIDLGTNQIIPLQQPIYGGSPAPSSPSAQPSPQGDGLYEMADDATGIWPTLRTGAANTLGQLPGSIGDTFDAPEQVRAAQEFELLKRNLIQSLSLNPRFPVAEQERIENLVPRGVFTSPETLKTSLQALDRDLARIEEMALQGMNNPSTPVEQRQADAATLRAVREARQRLGVPPGKDGKAEALKRKYGLE